MRWSENQSKAINHCDHPIIVAASAGAGKTAVLTQRIIKRCLKDGIDIDRIVALTFTKAAAEEMKTRIHQALTDALNDDGCDKTRIEKQLVLLSNAKISTIHSFCLDIIKKHGYVLGFDPGRIEHMIDGVEMAQIKAEAFGRTIEKLDENDYQILMDTYALKPLDHQPLKRLVESIYNQACNANDPLEWINGIKNFYPMVETIHDMAQPLKSMYLELSLFTFQRIKQAYATIKINADQEYLEKNKDLFELLDEVIQNIAMVLTKEDLDGLRDIIEQQLYLLNGLPGSKKFPLPLQDALKTMKTLVESMLNDLDQKTLVYASNRIASVVEPLIHVVTIYMEMIETIKSEHNGIDFNDMEALAYRILHENADIAMQYQHQFQEICVDEFQDTSIRQDAIISMVSNGKNIFRVGDVKQSIYGFRQASPQLMRNLLHDPNQEVIGLTENYRSGETIINFTNALFSKLMNIDSTLDEYGLSDIVTAGSDNQKIYHDPVEFHVINKDAICDLDHIHNGNSRKAWYMAKTIMQMVKTSRFHDFKDYCILVRSRSAMIYIQRAFDALHIPYAMNLKSGLNNSDAIRTLKAFVDCVVNPQDTIGLTTLLTSPLYNMDLQSLSCLCHQKNLYDALVQTNHPLLNHLSTGYTTYIQSGIHGLIHYFLSTMGYYRLLDTQGVSNMDALIERIHANPQWNTLDQLSLALDASNDTDSSEIDMIEPKEDVVRIMTMHQSKGLQFPVVLIWSDTTNRNQDIDRILTNAKYGLGIKAKAKEGALWMNSLPYLYIRHKHNLDDLSERIRLLYVALTRAKEKLLIMDCMDEIPLANGYTMENLLSRKGFSDCILSVPLPHELFEIHQFNQPYTLIPYEDTSIEADTLGEYMVTMVEPSKSQSATSYMKTIDLVDHEASLQYGTLLHEALEVLDLDQLNEHDLTIYDSTLTYGQKKALISYGQTMKAFINAHHINEIEKEYPFIYHDQTNTASGSMDWIGEGDDGIHIVDYKTTNASEDDLISKYHDQLHYYKEIIHKEYPNTQIHLWIYSFHHGKFIPVV